MVSSLNSEVETQLERLIGSVKPKKGTALARLLGVKPQAVSNAKTKGAIPKAWFVIVSEETGVSADWLLTGEGPKRRGEVRDDADDSFQQRVGRTNRLELQLDEERELNRELIAENRKLWKENGDLRVELERMKARAAPDQETPNEAHRKAG